MGGRFRFRGEDYERTGPMTGRHLVSGKGRLIPRSAWVEPLSGAPQGDAEHPAGQASISAIEVRAALDELCADLSNMTGRMDPASAAELEGCLSGARKAFLKRLGLT